MVFNPIAQVFWFFKISLAIQHLINLLFLCCYFFSIQANEKSYFGLSHLLAGSEGSEYSLFTSDGASQNNRESGVYSYLNNFHVLAGKMGAEFATENKINTLLFKPRSNRRNDQS